MQETLAALPIPSVIHSTGNLFDSHEAMEMERVLSGVAMPNDGKALRAALATDMTGLRGEDIEALMEDEILWESWLVKFREYQELWNEEGFIRMFRRFLTREKVLARLMTFPDGERRGTNVLHLSEVLHQASVKGRLDSAGLLKWLSEERAGDGTQQEEHPIRLESDERAVRLVTTHKSKGLEYPVVFYPFGWDGSGIRSSSEPFAFHDERSSMDLTLDLGSGVMEETREIFLWSNWVF
jgi:exodeoxyribonuclease V beta subunit